MIAFRTKSTLVHYHDEYFNCKEVVEEEGNDNDNDENGLVIGAYEVSFCDDVGTYRDYGLTMFNKHLSIRQATH
eukprot:10172103-Ditylum_brightwellii.AAC.1